jgi:hypothetical protein
MENAEEAAPSYQMGATWTPTKMTPHDWPYILDNGVFSCWRSGNPWSFYDWLDTIDDLEDMPRQPDFVVLPDVVGEADASYDRSCRFVDKVPDRYPTALAVQNGMGVEEWVMRADELDCEWIFVGGDMPWKRRFADQFVMTGHDWGMNVHIARPGLPEGLLWAKSIGADSVDTTTIARNRSYHHLRKLEEQSTFEGFE